MRSSPEPEVFSSKTSSGRSLSTALFVGLLILLFAVITRKQALGTGFVIWDADQVCASVQVLVADCARAGKLLIWNPWGNCGVPEYLDPQSGTQSPLSVLMGLITGGTVVGFHRYWLLVWLMGGIGMMVLARHLRAPAWGCFVVAAGFTFSGFFTGHAEHTPFVHAFAALPWIIWRMDAAWQGHRLRPAVEAGAIWGLAALSGYPAVVFMNGVVVFLWVVGRTACSSSDGPVLHRAGFAVKVLLAWGIIGVLVLSPTYAAFAIEGKGYSDRSSPLPRDLAVGSNSLDPAGLTSLASPYLPMLNFEVVSRNCSAPLCPHTDVSSISVYAGTAVAWLALAALLLRYRSAWRWWLLILGGVGVALALGTTLPVRGWLYDYVPPARYFRHSAIFRGCAILALAILAALACRDLGDMFDRSHTNPSVDNSRPGRRWYGRFALLSAGLITVAASTFVYAWVLRAWGVAIGAGDRWLADAHIVLCWGGVLFLALLTLLPLRVLRCLLPSGLVLLAVGDALLTAQLSARTVLYEGPWSLLIRDQWREIMARHSKKLDLGAQGLARHDANVCPGWHNKNYVMKVPVFDIYSALANRFHQVWKQDPLLREEACGGNRIWFAPVDAVAQVGLSDRTFAAFQQRSHELEALPVLIHPRETMMVPVPAGNPGPNDERDDSKIRQLPAAQRADITVRRYIPDRLTFSIDAPQAGYVLVTDRWARGWQATVNGQPAPVLGGDFIFRAIPVQTGPNHIDLRYRPFGFPWLLALSWGTLALVLAGPALVWSYRLVLHLSVRGSR